MRLDKFLKVSRLIKRRTLAKDICEGGKIQINGRVAKPGTTINPGDILELDLGHRIIKVEILQVKDNVKAAEAGSLYRELEE